jgi:hypothetical protein
MGEVAVDLDGAEREPLQGRQGGIAGAEVSRTSRTPRPVRSWRLAAT